MGSELYYSLLKEVSQEIDASLRDASFSIESFLHEQADEQDLLNCLGSLHQVSGALEMMGNNGALLLARELESLAHALKDGKIESPQDAIELLTRGIMELPRYLNLVIDGEHDHPAIFLPLVNEMRVLQQKKYLPEASVVAEESDQAQAEVHLAEADLAVIRQTRGKILKAIVEWLKGNFSDKVLQHLITQLQAAVAELEDASASQYLTLYANVAQELLDKRLTAGNEEHHTIASIDKYLQALLADNQTQIQAIQARLSYNYANLKGPQAQGAELDKSVVEGLLHLQEDLSRVRERIHNSEGEEKYVVTRLISDELQNLEGHVESILHNHVYENWNTVVLIAHNIVNSASIAFEPRVSEYLQDMVAQLQAITLDDDSIEMSLEHAATLITTMAMVVDQNIFSTNHYLDPQKGSISNRLLQNLAEKIHDELTDISDLILAQSEVNLADRRDDIVTDLSEIAGAYDFINSSVAAQIHEVVQSLKGADDAVLYDSVVVTNFVGFLVALEEYSKCLDEHSSRIEAESIFGDLVTDLQQQIGGGDDELLNLDDMDIELEMGEEEPSLEGEAQLMTGAVSAGNSDEEDDELVGIFIEEAEELLQTIGVNLIYLQQDAGDTDSLSSVRRAFHSLKGSGRVAGANSIAAIAWEMEQELNQILERNEPATTQALERCAQARDLIESLLIHFRQGETDVPEIEASFLPTPEVIPTESVEQAALDPVLHEIYSNETNGHLDTVTTFASACGQSNNCYVSDELIRALHTLTGSSEMAQVKDVARIASALEKYAHHLDKNEQACPPEFITLLAEVSEAVQGLLPQLLQDNARLERREEFLQGLESLYHIKPEAEDDEDGGEQELFDIFVEEAEEILERLDAQLAVLGDSHSDKDALQRLQRELHTLKGSSRMATVFSVADLSHATENVLNAVVNQHLQLDDEVYHTLQKVQGQLLGMVAELHRGMQPAAPVELIAELEALSGGESPLPILDDESLDDLMNMALESLDDNPATAEDTATEVPEEIGDYPSSMAEDEEAISRLLLDTELDVGTGVNDEFESQSTSARADSEDSGGYTEIEPAAAALALSISDDEVVTAPAASRTVQDSDLRQGSIERATQVRVRSELLDDLLKSSGQITIYNTNLEQKIDAFKSNVGDFVHTVERLKDQIKQLEIETEAQIRSGTSTGLLDADSDFDPLEFDRYSQLQTISRGLVESLNDLENIESDLSSKLQESENLITLQNRINTELHEGIMRSRMVAFSTVLPRLERVVNQTAHELNKKVIFNPVNTDKEIDNNLLQSIIAPIEHILRNAVAHGIEREDEREDTGKDMFGDVTLALSEMGTELIIRISDDGAGLDLPRIRDKAVELGLIDAQRQYSDDYLAQLILESGLSTAAELNQISGRGVGMDVVANDIKHHGGVLHIATQSGRGTSFTIHLPQKLSLAQALLVRDGPQIYALPVTGVEGFEYLNLQGELPEDIIWRGETYEFIRLSELLGQTVEHDTEQQSTPAIFFFLNERRYALIADDFLGNREVIIKPLGPQLETVPYLNGGAILGSGEIALIINLPRLLRLAENMALQQPLAPAIRPTTGETNKVLVVDDSLTVRKVTSNFLKRHDFEVISARDGVEAIAVLEEDTPDVILLDIEMPRMNGYEFMQYLRADARSSSIPVIMITSRTGEKHRQRAFELGVNAYMGKPYQEEMLLAEINSLVGA